MPNRTKADSTQAYERSMDTQEAIDSLIQEIKALKRQIDQQNETIAINKERIAKLEAKLGK
jgi:hypothetical protein